MNIKEIGLSSSAFGYSMGNIGKSTDKKNPKPWILEGFVDFAIGHDFGGIEVPLSRFVPDLEPSRLKELKKKLSDHNLFFIMDSEVALDVEQIRTLIPLAKEFGSPIIRIKSSNILGCDRKKLGKPWNEHVRHVISVLSELTPLLRQNGLRIAIENHQDLDSNDLLQIIEVVGADVVGVNFDIGNAFATCEDPIVFANKLGPHIINIHLKEYKIFKSEEGFRLVRCSIGDGSVDFKKVLPLLARNCPNAKMVIELGALEARNISWLGSDFWEEIKPRNHSELVTFFQLLEHETVRVADGSWQTPWEAGEPVDKIISYEATELETSLKYLLTLRP
ncbi:MAG: sugar phosphate isomerase/epimerase family protein [bacterium]|nr:sugar phosphate isomerase/epimerase family protein [bacterium]